MVEAGGNECPIEIVSTAFDHLQTMIAEICAIQQEFINKCTISPKEITLNYPTQQQLDEMHTVVTDEEISTLFKKEKTVGRVFRLSFTLIIVWLFRARVLRQGRSRVIHSEKYFPAIALQ